MLRAVHDARRARRARPRPRASSATPGQRLAVRTWKRDSRPVQPARLDLEDRMVGDHDVARAHARAAGRSRTAGRGAGAARDAAAASRCAPRRGSRCGSRRLPSPGAGTGGRRSSGGHEVIAVVGVKALLGIGDVRAHAVAGRPAEIAHVIDHGAVPLLRHRPGDERGQEPEHRDAPPRAAADRAAGGPRWRSRGRRRARP